MYLKHFRLRERPFELTSSPSYYYGPAHQVALNELSYSIEEEQGLALLFGAHGVGKTTVLKRLKESLPKNLVGVVVSDHALDGSSLVDQLQAMLGLGFPRASSHFLAEYLRARAGRGEKLVLLVDEAHALTASQLEEIRFLTDLEQGGRRVTEVVLAGPPALGERLAEPGLAGLRQRVAIEAAVSPLSASQTRDYVDYRLRVAGAEQPLFSDDALASVYVTTGGVPRLVNLLCERSLVAAFAHGRHSVDGGTVAEAKEDLTRPEPERDGSRAREAAADRDIEDLFTRLERIEAAQQRILDLLEQERRVEGPRPLSERRKI